MSILYQDQLKKSQAIPLMFMLKLLKTKNRNIWSSVTQSIENGLNMQNLIYVPLMN